MSAHAISTLMELLANRPQLFQSLELKTHLDVRQAWRIVCTLPTKELEAQLSLVPTTGAAADPNLNQVWLSHLREEAKQNPALLKMPAIAARLDESTVHLIDGRHRLALLAERGTEFIMVVTLTQAQVDECSLSDEEALVYSMRAMQHPEVRKHEAWMLAHDIGAKVEDVEYVLSGLMSFGPEMAEARAIARGICPRRLREAVHARAEVHPH